MTTTTPTVPERPDPPRPPDSAMGEYRPGLLDRWSDPTMILVAAAVLAIFGLIPSAIKAPITLPLVLLLPGHALLATLDRPDRHLGLGPRMALRLITSISIVGLVVLLVGALFSVSRISTVAGVWAFISIAALTAWDRELPDRAATSGPRWTQSGVLLALAAVASTFVVFLAIVFLPQPRGEDYSSLALAGTSKRSGSPIVVRSGTTAEVQVRVENGTDRTVSYRVIPAIDGGEVWKAPRVRLQPGESWTGTVKGKIPKDACLSRLTISLSADGEDSGVRPLILYVRNAAGDACG
jgi:uncharacterized membrane protein